jgi:hypothetical protein
MVKAQEKRGAHASEKPTTDVKRLDVGISRSDYEELDDIADHLGVGLAEYIANSIRVYTHLQRALANGKEVYLGRDGKAETELEISLRP